MAAADAYVNGSSTTTKATNYGGATSLRADADPEMRSYLRFSVQGLAGPPRRATLRVYATSSHGTGYRVHGVADTGWGEGTLTCNNAPAYGGVVGTSGGFGAGAWTSVDVTPLVTGNGPVSLALTTGSATQLSLASRETANAPHLVIEPGP